MGQAWDTHGTQADSHLQYISGTQKTIGPVFNLHTLDYLSCVFVGDGQFLHMERAQIGTRNW
jgi:hypothetical protein